MYPLTPKFSSSYELIMPDSDHQAFMREIKQEVENTSDTFSQAGRERYFVSFPDAIGMSSTNEITIDNKLTHDGLGYINIETNQAGHEKTKDLSLFNQLQSLCNESMPVFQKTLQRVIDTMSMKNADEQKLLILGDTDFNVIPADILKDVNAENHERRRHLHQALKDSNFELTVALLSHPDIDLKLENSRGYSTMRYFEEYDGPNKYLIKQLFRVNGIYI